MSGTVEGKPQKKKRKAKKFATKQITDYQIKKKRRKNKRRKTENIIDYDLQIKRIKDLVRRNVKKGYIIDIEEVIPKRPKRITKKAIERLKGITREKIFINAKFKRPDVEGGKEISANAAKKILRAMARDRKDAEKRQREEEKNFRDEIDKALAKSDKETVSNIDDLILQQIEEILNNFIRVGGWNDWQSEIHEHNKNIVESMLNDAISKLGKHQVAKNLEQNAKDIISMVYTMLFDSDQNKVQINLVWFYSYLYGVDPNKDMNEKLNMINDIINSDDDSDGDVL